MRIIWLQVYRKRGHDEKAVKLLTEEELGEFSFFRRPTMREFLTLGARTVVERTALGSRTSVRMQDDMPFVCHCRVRADSLAACVITDTEYHEMAAHNLLNLILKDFDTAVGPRRWQNTQQDGAVTVPEIAEKMRQYQDPEEADKLLRIQRNIDEVMEIMHRNMEEILRRGETLDSLASKADDISAASYGFYRTAKRNNQCCKAY
ncbi:MAG: hypothetical protein MHM6MM_006911 [Cercozoa sp. M6MM]